MKFEFTNMLYSEDGLDKPRGLVTNKTRTSYPGIEALKNDNYDVVGVHWISKDSSNKSAFTLKKGINDGDHVFAIIENEDDTYSLYVYKYDENKLYNINDPEDIIEINKRRFSIHKDQLRSFNENGTVEEINKKIIEISKQQKGTQNNG